MARYVSGTTKAKRAAYRQTDAYKLARRMYRLNPEVKLRMALRRKIKKHMKGLS